MVKFKIFIVLITLSFCVQFSYASDCAGITVEQSFKQNNLVVFADVISTKLTRDQFINDYLLKRKELKGFNETVHTEKARQDWLSYEKRPNFTYLLVKGVLKGGPASDGIIKVINTPNVPIQIGKTYILFLSKPYKNQDVFIMDDCIYFNFTDREYIQGDQYFSKPGTFEGALDNLMFYRNEKTKHE